MAKTHIVTISDTHNQHDSIKVPDGDIIIHAGDFTGRGLKYEIENFIEWFAALPHTWKILIAGNHDKGTDPDQTNPIYVGGEKFFKDLCALNDIIVLEDDSCDVMSNDGELIKIWGSPVSPTFGRGWAWNRDRGLDIKKHWDKIPEDIDIIVTHGPPFMCGDRVNYPNTAADGSPLYNVGCAQLLDKINKTKCKMTVSGHIHEDRGVKIDKKNGITHVNASSLNLQYTPYLDNTFRFDWDSVKEGKSIGEDYE